MAFALQRDRWLSNKTGKVFFSRDFFLRGEGYDFYQRKAGVFSGLAWATSGSIRKFQ